MAVFNRFFSFVFGCLLVVAGVLTFTDGLGFTYVAENLAYIWQFGVEGTITLIAGAAVFAFGFVIILANLCIKAPKSVKVPGTDGANSVYITLNTIENMARNAAMAVPGVVSVNTKIKSKSKGLKLLVKISVSFDDKINDVTEGLQRDIRDLIEGSTSLTVYSVEVLVTKASSDKSAAAYRGEVVESTPVAPSQSDSKAKTREATIPLNRGEQE